MELTRKRTRLIPLISNKRILRWTAQSLARNEHHGFDSAMKLPNPDKAIIPREKIEGYLLSPIHSVGRQKAVFFNSLGYTQAEWQSLEYDIRQLLTGDAQPTEETEYGRKYWIRAIITGPNDRSATIITAWFIPHGEGIPRFITAYPED